MSGTLVSSNVTIKYSSSVSKNKTSIAATPVQVYIVPANSFAIIGTLQTESLGSGANMTISINHASGGTSYLSNASVTTYTNFLKADLYLGAGDEITANLNTGTGGIVSITGVAFINSP